ncbi:restriction endonuclease subunit S [Limosilactobacillus reuteri]|uniref:restriction endonuclease subunit S n=1 Tax=Limosilactobacillus reuteri TaxID=1598 RepID=UPI0028F0305B|nr:restriction endonuclease subunit S [Limosilactobacillus reuteri]
MFFSVLSIIFIKVRINVKWEQHKLGEISFKVNTKNKENLTLPVLSNSAEYGIVNQEDYFDKKIANRTDNYYIVKHNDFVYNPRISKKAPYGPIRRNTLDTKGLMSPLYYVFRINDGNYIYLDYYFKSSKWYKFMYQNGDSGARSDRFAIKDKIFQMMPINMPNTKEQNKIGQLIQTLQKLIDLQQRKLEQLKQLKKAMLQQLFVNKNNKQPNLRFKNFNGDWKQHKLKDISAFENGRAYKQNELLKEGKYPVLRVGNFYTKDQWYYSNLELDKNKYANNGDLLYTWSATFGPHIWSGPQVIYHYHIWKIQISNKINKFFLYSFLEADKVNLLHNTNGSTMIHITKSNMENKVIMYPKTEEQLKIGQISSHINNSITLQQNKLTQLTIFKKYLLQKMFI